MSDVSLKIGGRHYRVACAPGEEPRLERLGSIINAKLASEPGLTSQTESRMLLFAALLLADQVDELQRNPPPAAPAEPAKPEGPTPEEQELVELLELFAEKLETIADQLEVATQST